jgi:phosphate starvation-inducible PhoH-like protein|tara:strand:- start:1967 stop:2689 length:723 start_codon:yes stop_codon:yes gene_type:complete
MSRRTKNKPRDNQNIININEYIKRKNDVVLVPRNLNQETYISQLLDPSNVIVVGVGPAGTGKTMLAVLAALKGLKERTVDKIIITRPAVGVDDERHGFLPGDLNRKMEPWTRPIFDVIQEYYSPKEIKHMIDEMIIEISPLAFMRGRTFKDSYIIADEMQNATPNQMKMLLTRIGENSRMAVTGDIHQTDRRESQNGLIDFGNLFNKYADSQYIRFVKFSNMDIERHPVVSEVLSIYGDK